MKPVPPLDDLAPPKQAVLYLRVSSKRQTETARDIDKDGNSIATQRELCDQKAQSMGVLVAEEFVEPGASAQTIEKRPVFQQMLRYLTDHREVGYVIVYARSRAFRNFVDAAITKRHLDKLGVRLLSAREDFGEGTYAEAMEAVTDIMNQVQNQLSGEDIRVKMRHKALNGGTVTRAKLGYLNVRQEFEGHLINTVALDERRAPLILQAFELYATGDYTLERLHDQMADLGLTIRPSARWPEQPVSVSKLHRMLSDPYYVGFVTYKGEVYPGRHEPIVGQELFDRVQDVLEARSARGNRDRVHQHYLKGMLFCDRCRRAGRTSRLVYNSVRGNNGTRYAYFVCRGRQDGFCDVPHLAVELVEDAIVEHYRGLRLPKDFAAEVRRRLEAAMADEQGSVRALHAQLTRQLKELDVKEERLLDLAADGTLPQAKIRARLHQLRVERTRIEDGRTHTGEELAVGGQVLLQALDLVADPQTLYRTAPDHVRRLINQTFFQRFYVDNEGVTGEELQAPFDELQQARHAYAATQKSPRDAEAPAKPETDLLFLRDVFLAAGSSKTVLVELRGIEPLTSSMRTKRATNCATAPRVPFGTARKL